MKFLIAILQIINFIECAVDRKADYIITGDKHLLELKKYKKIKKVAPKTFINIF